MHHSCFADDKIYETLDNGKIPQITGVISLDDFSMITAQKL